MKKTKLQKLETKLKSQKTFYNNHLTYESYHRTYVIYLLKNYLLKKIRRASKENCPRCLMGKVAELEALN